MKKLHYLIHVITVLLLLCVGCALPAQPNPESEAQNSDTSENKTIQTEEYEYVKAELKDNTLSITILSEYIDSYPMLEENRDKIIFDQPYIVSGLSRTYTGFYLDTMGNDIWPYLMLLTDRGTVEYIDIANQLFGNSGESAQDDAAISFHNCGEIFWTTDIVSFRTANVSGEDGGYITIFAIDSQKREYDLAVTLFLMKNPQELPPTGEYALEILESQLSEIDDLPENARLFVTGHVVYIAEEYCTVVAQNGLEQDNPRYAVSKSKCIYKTIAEGYTWMPANPRAQLFGRTEYDELFAIITDPASPEYLYYAQRAQFISTPAVGLEGADPVLLVSLKDGLSLEICLSDYYPDTGQYNVNDSLNEMDASLGSSFEIGVQLSDGVASLIVIGRWNDGFNDYTAIWNAHREEDGNLSTKIVTGSLVDPTFMG